MPKKILLVEDDRKMLDFMRRYLENRRLHKGGDLLAQCSIIAGSPLPPAG